MRKQEGNSYAWVTANIITLANKKSMSFLWLMIPVCGQLHESWGYHAGQFNDGAGLVARELDGALHGCMIGQREGVKSGSFGNAEDIISFGCHHLKKLFLHIFLGTLDANPPLSTLTGQRVPLQVNDDRP